MDFQWMRNHHNRLLSMGWHPESGFIKSRWSKGCCHSADAPHPHTLSKIVHDESRQFLNVALSRPLSIEATTPWLFE
jgi:hypothetical protein